MRRVTIPLLLFGLILAGCATPADTEGPDVVATFYPLAWAARQIAQQNVSVDTHVPAGIEPHDWEPGVTDVTRLANARLVVKQGAGFEPWLDGLLANLGARAPAVVDTTEGLPLVEGEEEHEGEDAREDEPHLDPHTWLDPILFTQQAKRIEEALVETFPEHAGAFRERGAQLASNLEALDRDYADALGSCATRVIITNHDAYSYLAARYDFEVVAISGLSPEAEPSPADISRAVDAAREHNITVVFFEELVSPRVAEVVAEEVGAQTRVLSPIESEPENGDYVSRMHSNLLGLREAMRCT